MNRLGPFQTGSELVSATGLKDVRGRPAPFIEGRNATTSVAALFGEIFIRGKLIVQSDATAPSLIDVSAARQM